jgi:tetratricopeptide (TPR) repeat protein
MLYRKKILNIYPDKKLWLFFQISFIFCSSFLVAQHKTSEIDFLIEKAEQENIRSSSSKSIDYALKAYQYSLESNYKKGIVESQYELAMAHYTIGKYKDAYEFIDNIEANYKSTLEKDQILLIKFTELKGKLQLWRGFKEDSKNTFLELLQLSSQLKEDETRNINELKALSLLGINPQYDSAKYYLKKAITYRSKIKDETEFILPYINLARYHANINQDLDSATYYNEMANGIAQKINSRHLFLIVLQQAQIASLNNNQELALEKSFEALQLAKDQKRSLESLEAYKLIAENYGELKNYQKQAEYLQIYNQVNDSIYNDLHSNLFSRLKTIESDMQVREKMAQNRMYLFFGSIIAFIIILSYFLFRILKIKNTTKIHHSQIEEKDKEVEVLLHKLQNDKQEDLLYIAQHKPAEFPEKFNEVYSDFVQKLLEIEPNLVNSELTFCAYLRLKFTTKDIANIMYVTPKAIQNRKNRIRKKLNIPSEEDIYVWFNNL